MSQLTGSNHRIIASGEYSKNDFESDQALRWCPGCGDYSILAQMQRVMPSICEELQLPRENIVFVSGIGCSSRFPYYMNTYGFHTIHGRAPTIATGLRVGRPDLQVWVVTGDGDGMSIGMNHLFHCLRRNIDIKILLFNNRIYGLTKGQYSPTSEIGKRTKSSPMGTFETPANPLYTAITAGATFAARTIATDATHLQKVLMAAAQHRGSAFVEIFQNCNVFNDGAFDSFATKAARAERTLYLEDGEPLVFGKDKDKVLNIHVGQQGSRLLEIAHLSDIADNDRIIHRPSSEPNFIPRMLAHLDEEEFPVPLGIFQQLDKPIYGDLLNEQISVAEEKLGHGDFMDYLNSGETWTVD